MTPIEHLGIGLAIASIGIALFMGLPPPWWSDMPKPVVQGGVALGVILFCLGAAIVLYGTRSAPGQETRMLPLLGMAVFGLAFLGCVTWYFWPTKEGTAQAVAKLAELGWTVKPGNPEILFEITARPLPSMRESATYFSEIRRPFKLHFQQVPSLDGLHFLADIQDCKNIEIGAGSFVDLSELSGFLHLETLIISQTPLENNQVIDPSPLASLINLRSLNLNMSRIRTSDFLANLKNLKTLYLGGTLISDISSLAGLKDLENISIRDTRVADLRPLMGLDQLSDIEISGAQIPGLVNLSGLPNLKRLLIIEQRPADLSPLGELKQLTSIFIWGLPSFDLSAFHNLTKLENLQLGGIGFNQLSAISHVDSLSNLSNLKQFSIGEIAFANSDMDVIRSFSKLEELNFHRLPITSIAAVEGLRFLKKVSLSDVPVIDISPLLRVPNLAEASFLRVPARSDILTQLQKDGVKVRQP